MAYNRTAVLSTREEARGDRLVGQAFSVPGGRLDKVSLYLEPSISDPTIGATMTASVSVFDVDSSNLPTGSPLATDSIAVSDMPSRRFYNFATSAATPPKVAIILTVANADENNFVGWRYVQTDSEGEPVLVSDNGGATWVADTTRKMAYIAYSHIPDAVTFEDSDPDVAQTARIKAGDPASIVDDSVSGFDDAEKERVVVDGSNVVISFGDFIISLVIDMSGSMTWNDRDNLRLQFLKDYIDDMESALPTSSQALYSLVKFNSRKVGRMRILLQDEANAIAGVRVVRKAGTTPVSGPTDGIVIFEGLAEEMLDPGLVEGGQYQYAAFAFDDEGNFSEGRHAPASPTSTPRAPLGVAGFSIEEEEVLNGTYDIGKRRIAISWSHPQIENTSLRYEKIHLVRRDDRPPETPLDGTVLFSDVDSSSGLWDATYYDFDTPFSPLVGTPKDHSDYPVAGLTYYYALFTENSSGVRCLRPNAGAGSVTISEADKFWERAEPPFDDPLTYGYDDTAPLPPTMITSTTGDGELFFSWVAGDAASARFVVYYKADSYPSQVGTGNDAEYDGEIVYNGSSTSFVHRDLENGQPHFYTIVAFDSVGNSSTGVQFTARPEDGSENSIPPAAVGFFEAEPYNSATNRLSWSLPLDDSGSFDGWLDDAVEVVCNVTFADSNTRTTSATLEIVEEERSSSSILPDNTILTLTEKPSSRVAPGTASITNTVDGEQQTTDISDAIVPTLALNFGSTPQEDATTVTSVVRASSSQVTRSRLSEVGIRVHGLLSVREASSGRLITGIKTKTVNVQLKNPFNISISNEPESVVNRPTWDPTCTTDISPEGGYEQLPGVYAGTGDGFPIVIEASYRDLPLEENINLFVRILDKATGEVATTIQLPNANSTGIATFVTREEEDEILDRSGQPTGETENVTRVSLELPPQASPGDYTVEVTGSYQGYSKTTSMDVHYESPLNIDLNLVPFTPDGISATEQSAFVYLGDPLGEEKTPVADLTVTEWKISALDPVSRKNIRKRPFYSRDTVPGTGVKSYVRGGTAKNIFFGPSVDVGPETDEEQTLQETSSCIVGGEIYEVSVTAKAEGFSRTAFGSVILSPSPEAGPELNRVFLRRVDGFNKDIVYADGIAESSWEVVVDPGSDGSPSDTHSGVFFRDAMVNLGGSIPQLDDGTVVTLTVKPYHGATDEKVYIRTNLTGDEGRPWFAKATIQDGRALFHVRLNTRVSGKVLPAPNSGSDNFGSNIIYGEAGNVGWEPSALIFSLSAYVSREIGGRAVAFYGGGSNIEFHTPPCFLSFREPLGLGIGDAQQ